MRLIFPKKKLKPQTSPVEHSDELIGEAALWWREIMGRCEYRHHAFIDTDVYRGDQTEQCWVTETGNFGTDEEPEHYCIFHAHESMEPVDHNDWPIEGRGELQAKALRALLDEWNDANKQHSHSNQGLVAFKLPGLHCGEIRLDGFAFSGAINIDEATFSGDASFDGATFSGDALFAKATFSGDALFAKATFSAVARFSNATFSGVASFHEATFWGYAWFSEATFGTDAWFHGVTFGGEAHFRVTTFMGAVWFRRAIFWGGFHLSGGRLDRPVMLIKCAIRACRYEHHAGEALIFNQCEVPEEADPSTVGWNFTNQDCSRLGFLNTALGQADFLGADVRETRFDSCIWEHPGGSRYAKVVGHNEDTDQGKLRLLQSLYSQLNKNMEDNRDYRLAGDFHYREMEIRQRLLVGTGFSSERMVLWLYGLVADFGENWVKVFGCLVLSFFATGFAISCVEVWDCEGELLLDKIFFEYPHYTQIAILGIIPSGFQRGLLVAADLTTASMFLIALQVMVSLTLTTLFVMAIRRRFKR